VDIVIEADAAGAKVEHLDQILKMPRSELYF
jgi:hypothetical protein